jgi:hypothetical protein
VTATNSGGSASATSNSIAIPAGSVTISGTLPDAIVGQAYDASLIVIPSGSPIILPASMVTALSAQNISHNGFGRFTSAGVTA